MKYKSIICILTFIIITSCKRKNEHYDSFFNGEYVGKKDIKFKTISIDTLVFEPIESSYSGDIQIYDSRLFFLDEQFGYLFEFNQDGKLVSKEMGQGEGPKEINTKVIDGYLRSANKNHVFLGATNDIHIHDKFGERIQSFYTDWDDKIDPEKINFIKEYSGNEHAFYSFEYVKIIIREDSDNNLYIPIQSSLENFNPYMRDYYLKSRILAKIDMDKKKVVGLFGRRSPEYLNYHFVGPYSFISFDIDTSDKFYICYEIDSLIYVYDNKFRNIYSFGNKGIGMDTNYKELYKLNMKEIKKAYQEDRPKRGYYTYIEYFDEFDILFRSYKKGEHKNGLQIYKGTTLIADVEVPKGLIWVKGYIAPYFYSNAILNEESLTLKSYRFKLPEELLKK